MKRHLMVALFAVGAAGTAYDADAAERQKGRGTVDQALEQLYPAKAGHEHYVKDPREVNGVQVYDVDVKAPGGTTFAQVTEYGDFLVSGAPVDGREAPPPVREVVEGLFKETPNVDAFVATYYYVYTRTGDKAYELRLDAAGRLLDVKTQSSVNAEVPKKQTEAAQSEHERLVQAARSRFGEVAITGMYEWWEASPDFYVVNVQRDDDKGFVIVGPGGTIYSQRMDIDTNQLPEPVVRTVDEVFRADIRNAQKGEQQYWQFRQPVGEETLTLRIRPSGEILDITSDQPTTEDERLASERQKATADEAGDDRDRDDRDRDRDRRDRDRAAGADRDRDRDRDRDSESDEDRDRRERRERRRERDRERD